MVGEQDFTYDTAADTYRWPGGQTLRFLSLCQATQRRIYAAPAAEKPRFLVGGTVRETGSFLKTCGVSPSADRAHEAFDKPLDVPNHN